MKGLPLNGKYNGYASAPVMTNTHKMTWMEHTYDGPTSLSLLDPTGPLSSLRYDAWSRNCVGQVQNFWKANNQGPPYGSFGKLPTFIPFLGLEP